MRMDEVNQPGDASALARLGAAYTATCYRVTVGDGLLDIRIGEVNPELDCFLTGKGARSWVFVSAVNPRSRILLEAENAVLHAGLCAEVSKAGLQAYLGEALADAGDWPVEAGLLVLDVSKDLAKDMGRRYGQNAVVWAMRGEPPRLLWCPQY